MDDRITNPANLCTLIVQLLHGGEVRLKRSDIARIIHTSGMELKVFDDEKNDEIIIRSNFVSIFGKN